MKCHVNQLVFFLCIATFALITFVTPVSAISVAAPNFTIFSETVIPQDNNAIISWKTDLPTKGNIEYSAPNGIWQRTPWTQEYHYEHSFTLIDLQPGTRYLYRINAEDVYGSITYETDIFITPGLEQPQSDKNVLGQQQTIITPAQEQPTNSIAQTDYSTPITTENISKTVETTPNNIREILLLLGGILVGAIAVASYQPVMQSIQLKMSEVEAAKIAKKEEQTKQMEATMAKEKAAEAAAAKKASMAKTVDTPPQPNRFQFKINN